jgi:hypothetical protein
LILKKKIIKIFIFLDQATKNKEEIKLGITYSTKDHIGEVEAGLGF